MSTPGSTPVKLHVVEHALSFKFRVKVFTSLTSFTMHSRSSKMAMDRGASPKAAQKERQLLNRDDFQH